MEDSRKIIVNQVRCLKCDDTPFSRHVHDFRYCKCGSIAVDGGQSYLRRVGDLGNYEEMSFSVDLNKYDDIVQSIEDHDLSKVDADRVSFMQHVCITFGISRTKDVDNLINTAIDWAIETGRNKHGIANAVIRYLHDEGII